MRLSFLLPTHCLVAWSTELGGGEEGSSMSKKLGIRWRCVGCKRYVDYVKRSGLKEGDNGHERDVFCAYCTKFTHQQGLVME